MEDLFVPDVPETGHQKEAEAHAYYLSDDPTQWIKEIIGSFLERFPYLQEEPITVSWTKKEGDKGYAVGTLNVLGASIPIIIRDFRLSPLDVMILPEITVPLNDFFIKQIYDKPDAFKGLQMKPKSTFESLFGGNNSLQFSPINEYANHNNRTTRDAVKVASASVIDKLSYVHKEDALELIKELQNPIIKKAFEKTGNLDIFKKIAEKAKESSKTASLDDILRNTEIDRQLVYQDTFGNHFVKQASSKFNKTWTTKISSVEAAELEEMILNDVTAPKIEKIASTVQRTPIQIEVGKSGSVGYIDPETEEYTPWYDEVHITKVEDIEERPKFASVSIQDSLDSLIFTKEGSWTVASSVPRSNMSFEDVEGSRPSVGDYGAFVTEKIATAPFEITGMMRASGAAGWEIRGEQGFMNKVAYYPIRVEAEGFEKHETEKNAFYVPKNAKFVKLAKEDTKLATLKDFEASIKVEGLNGFNKVAFYVTKADMAPVWLEDEGAYLAGESNVVLMEEEISAEREKNASALLNGHEVYRDKAGLYNFRGPEFAKYAQENPIRDLSELDAKWTLIHCGGTEEDMDKLASLKPNREFTIEGQIKCPMSLSELDSKVNNALEKQAGHKLKIAKLLVKEAAHFSDKTSVDAILSLNLMRRRNVEEYLAALPVLEEALSSIAKLLIGSRLGLNHTDASTIKVAMDALTSVVVQLYELQATIKEVK